MRGDVRPAQLVGGFGKDARHVERHVAMADHGRGPAAKIEMTVTVVGMPVVPSDKIAGVMAAGQAFAGDTQRSADIGAGSENHRVIAVAQLVDRHIASDRDPTDETKPRRVRDSVEGCRNQLELWVIGSYSKSNESVRHRKLLEHVDGERRARAKQRFRRVEAAWATADHRDAKAVRIGSVKIGFSHRPSSCRRASAPGSGGRRAVRTGVSAARLRLTSIQNFLSAARR